MTSGISNSSAFSRMKVRGVAASNQIHLQVAALSAIFAASGRFADAMSTPYPL